MRSFLFKFIFYVVLPVSVCVGIAFVYLATSHLGPFAQPDTTNTPKTIPVNDKVIDPVIISHINSNVNDDVETACGTLPWRATSIDYSHIITYQTQNSALVTVYVNPVIAVDGYFVNFRHDEWPTVFKDSKQVTGNERSSAIAAAIKAANGITGYTVTYTVTASDNEITTTDFLCSPQ